MNYHSDAGALIRFSTGDLSLTHDHFFTDHQTLPIGSINWPSTGHGHTSHAIALEQRNRRSYIFTRHYHEEETRAAASSPGLHPKTIATSTASNPGLEETQHRRGTNQRLWQGHRDGLKNTSPR